jgi:hypothetical protein
MARRLAARARSQNLIAMARRYELKHVEGLRRADLLRDVLDRGELAAAAVESSGSGPSVGA